MSDVTNSVAPGASSLSREQFLRRWDNNAGAQSVGDIDNQIITPAEIKQGGGVIAFAKDFESIAPPARANVTLEISAPARTELAQAVHNVRFRYFDQVGGAGAKEVAQRYQLRSTKARQHIQQATDYLVENGFEAKDLKGTQVITDPLGMTHVRFERLAYGRPMYGEQIVVHVKDGQPTVSGTTLPTPVVDGDASAASLEQVLAEAVLRFGISPTEVKVQESVIRDGDTAVVGWVIEMRNYERQDDQPRSMVFIVDGKESKFIDSFKGVGSVGCMGPVHTHEDDGFIDSFESSGGIVPPGIRAHGEQAAKRQGPAVVTPAIKALVQSLVRQEAVAPQGILSADMRREGDAAWAIKADEPVARPARPPRPVATLVDGPKPAKPTQQVPTTMDTFRLPLDHLMTGSGDDYVPYSARVNLATSPHRDGHALIAESWKHDGIETRDAQMGWSASGAVLVTDKDDTWSSGDTQAQRSAAAAHYGAMMTYTFLEEMGFNSIDLQGERLVSNVNIRRNYVNAYWDGKAMHYGEGDGRTAGPLTTLDIAGHEITHGLTERTANLIYRNESGGLNESFSDIAGFMVEYYASKYNPSVTPDWTMGEDTWTPTNGNHRDGLRYMDDPASDNYSVEHYSRYPQQTEVHGSSGIQNNAFYQLAYPDNRTKLANKVSGVAVENGIGVERSARVFFRALAYYLTPNSTFADARVACIQAAKDLYGADSVEAQKTAEAWSAVGVEDPS